MIYLKVCKQVEAISGQVGGKLNSFLLKKAMGVSQHHDAVSGTEKQHVTYDYAKRLAIGASMCQVDYPFLMILICRNDNFEHSHNISTQIFIHFPRFSIWESATWALFVWIMCIFLTLYSAY